jgi:hypothetical protein
VQSAVNPDRENNADADMPDDIDAVMDEPVEVLEPPMVDTPMVDTPMVDTPMVDTVKILDPVVAPEENTGTATSVPPLQPQPQPGVVGEVVAITITVTIMTKVRWDVRNWVVVTTTTTTTTMTVMFNANKCENSKKKL